MSDRDNLRDLGRITATSFGFGPLGPPDWLGMGVTTEDGRIIIATPTLQAVEAAAMHLDAAQTQAKKMPAEQIAAARERHMDGQLSVPIEATGVRLTEGGDELLVDLGIGVLRFRLLPDAKHALKEIAGELGGR